MKKFIVGILIIVCVILFSIFIGGCTDNFMTKKYGGSMTINIQPDEKLVNMTWKDSQLWILTEKRPVKDTIKKVYFLNEKSNFGVMEGKITIVEN